MSNFPQTSSPQKDLLPREKENSLLNVTSSPKLTPQKAIKQQAREARDKVLKEWAQKVDIAFEEEHNRRRSMGFTTEEQIRKSVEKEIRESRKAYQEKTPTKLSSFSPKKFYDTSNETTMSQFMKWVPWNAPSGTEVDKDGYAVPSTVPGSSNPEPWRTPERIKSPDEIFYTPAARSGRFSESFRQTLSPDKSLLAQLENEFQNKLSLESTKIGLIARKTIQGVELEQLLLEEQEKTWQSPMKRSRFDIPQFSGVRQSHPITKDHVDPVTSLPGAPGLHSDDEETLDGVSPLNSQADPVPPKSVTITTTTKVEPSPLPKILGAQLQAEINYVETSNRLSEKLDQVQEMLNTSLAQERETNLSAMLNEIELFDHSLPSHSLTPKIRYQRKKEPIESVEMKSATKTPKTVLFQGVDRAQAYQNFCKALSEYQDIMKKFVNQQKKIHELVKNTSSIDALYFGTVENYAADFKSELFQKKVQAKERSESREISDKEYISWTKYQRKDIETRTKFFSMIWMDIGKFILKHNIQAPSGTTMELAKPSNIARESAVEDVGKEWNISVAPEECQEKDIWNESRRTSSSFSPLDRAFDQGSDHEESHENEKDFWSDSYLRPGASITVSFQKQEEPKEVSSIEESSSTPELSIRHSQESEEATEPITQIETVASVTAGHDTKEKLSTSSIEEEVVTPTAFSETELPSDSASHIETLKAVEIIPPVITSPYHTSFLNESETDFLLGDSKKEENTENKSITEVTNNIVSIGQSTSSSSSLSSVDTLIPETKPSELQEIEESEADLSARTPLPILESPKASPSIPLLDLSALHSSGRVSIDASGLLNGEEEGLEDFLNRSGRRDTSQRYKLDASLLNDSSQLEEVQVVKVSPKRDIFNESFPKSPISPQQPASPKIATDVFKNRPHIAIDLNLTEDELLEDIKKPESEFDFTISAEVNEFEKNLEMKENQWEKFLKRDKEYKLEMIKECIKIVWKAKEENDGIPLELQSNWGDLIQKYPAPEKFDDPERQELFTSEWFSNLCDVFEIAGDLFPTDKSEQYRSMYYPLSTNNLTRQKFASICEENLLNKKKSTYVENLTRSYPWDSDPARRNAHEMIAEVHNIYLRKDLYDHTVASIEKKTWDAADMLLQQNVETVLNEARKSLGRESIVSQEIDLESL